MASNASLNVAFKSSGSESVSSAVSSIGSSSGSMANGLVSNRMAITELTRGMMQLGVATLGVGVAMKESNNQLISNIGNYVMLAGGLMSAVGSAAQLVKAITLITQALQRMIASEIIQKALSGPWGWAALVIGAAVAAGTVAGVSKYESTENKVNHNVDVKMGGRKLGSVAF